MNTNPTTIRNYVINGVTFKVKAVQSKNASEGGHALIGKLIRRDLCKNGDKVSTAIDGKRGS